MNAFQFTRRDGYACLVLALITLAVYSRMSSAGWVNFDDNRYVTQNGYIQSGWNRNIVKWAFTTGYADNWHPLTWISHAIDVRLYGLNPAKHHQTNILFHVCNTLLLFWWLRGLSGSFWRCAIVAGLFAWHPLHVESVAWVAERKDVLSTFFWMLALLAYTSYVRQPGPLRYLFTLFLFALGLMAKPMVVTLPCVLLLLDFWPLKRSVSIKKLVVEKLPFFALSALCCYITYLVQAAGGTTKALQASLGTRLANALIAYCRYVEKIFWPSKLAVFYPYNESPPIWEIILATLFIITVTVMAIRYWQSRPYLLLGWLFFLGTLVPTIGIIQVGDQSMADRYSYIPAIGIFIAVVWAAAEFCIAQKSKEAPLCVAGIVLAIFAITTWVQEGYWQNGKALFGHALDVTKENAVAEYNYASALFAEHNVTDALPHFVEASRLNPKHFYALEGAGSCLLVLGRDTEAADYFDQSIKAKPTYGQAHMKHGMTLERLGDRPKAIAEYRESLRLQPGVSETYYLLGTAFLSDNHAADAKTNLLEAVRLKPEFAAAHSKLAAALNFSGDTSGAISEYQTALKLDTNEVTAMNDLAWIKAANANPQFRNGPEAIALAQRACELTKNQQPYLIGTLAAAYAEAGQFELAVNYAEKARDLATANGLKEVSAKNDELMKLYRDHQPYHEKAN